MISSHRKVIHSSDFKKILKWRLKMRQFAEQAERMEKQAEPKEEFILTDEQREDLKEQEMQDIINQVSLLFFFFFLF